jgi:hypothetical protein
MGRKAEVQRMMLEKLMGPEGKSSLCIARGRLLQIC